MSWIQKVLEHSTKAGRITALIMVIMIAGSLDVIKAIDNPTAIDGESWKDLLLMIFAFYFATSSSKSNTP